MIGTLTPSSTILRNIAWWTRGPHSLAWHVSSEVGKNSNRKITAKVESHLEKLRRLGLENDVVLNWNQNGGAILKKCLALPVAES